MKNIVNVTPHSIKFRGADGEEYEVSPSGTILGAKFEDEPVGERAGATLVRIRVVPAPGAEEKLVAIETANPGAIVVDSLTGAQAFPGRVFALIAVPGQERGTAPGDRRYRDDRFTTF